MSNVKSTKNKLKSKLEVIKKLTMTPKRPPMIYMIYI